MVSEVTPTERAFDQLLAQPRENNALRWVLIDPPSQTSGSTRAAQKSLCGLATAAASIGGPAENFEPMVHMLAVQAAPFARSNELIRRMVTAKVRGAEAIIVSDPFNDDSGLMRASGMPGELLLPWRTTAAMIGGAEYMGQLRLPSGSENQVFKRPDGLVVMVAWNRLPTEETLFLGNNVQQFDAFGRAAAPEFHGKEQTIRVGPSPTFVLGLHEAITRWRMAVEFEKRQVPSVFAKLHPNSLHFRNYFPQGVGGSMKIVVLQSRRADDGPNEKKPQAEPAGFMLDRWTIDPPQATFQLAADGEMKFPFEVELRNALFGKQPVRIDFKVEADREYQFSAYSELEVGTKDLTLEVTSHLDKEGTLIVEQLMTNSAEQLADFKCYLRARGHRRQRMQVYRLGKEVDRKVYRFGNGRDLVGKEMLLELEELNGPRELRYRFIAKDMPVNPEAAKQVKPDSHSRDRASVAPLSGGAAVGE
jgi:hypothetical protein